MSCNTELNANESIIMPIQETEEEIHQSVYEAA